MTAAARITWEEAVETLRRDPAQRELVLACFYDDPLIEAARRFAACAEWRETQALLPPPPGRALDIGAGRGIASYALAAAGYDTTALEPDPSAVVGAGAIRALSRDAGLPIAVAEEWGESLPFPDGGFDIVVCRQVLHHARDLPRLCREIARVLRPGGVMVATREHVISRREDLPAFLASHPLHHLYGGENAFLLSEYEGAIRGAGLSLEKSLNPLQSEINLYPTTLEDHRRRLARRLLLPTALVGPRLMAAVGRRLSAPGRLYSFVARKPLEGGRS
jgi:SAM-dependent methyltransferase